MVSITKRQLRRLVAETVSEVKREKAIKEAHNLRRRARMLENFGEFDNDGYEDMESGYMDPNDPPLKYGHEGLKTFTVYHTNSKGEVDSSHEIIAYDPAEAIREFENKYYDELGWGGVYSVRIHDKGKMAESRRRRLRRR